MKYKLAVLGMSLVLHAGNVAHAPTKQIFRWANYWACRASLQSVPASPGWTTMSIPGGGAFICHGVTNGLVNVPRSDHCFFGAMNPDGTYPITVCEPVPLPYQLKTYPVAHPLWG